MSYMDYSAMSYYGGYCPGLYPPTYQYPNSYPYANSYEYATDIGADIASNSDGVKPAEEPKQKTALLCGEVEQPSVPRVQRSFSNIFNRKNTNGNAQEVPTETQSNETEVEPPAESENSSIGTQQSINCEENVEDDSISTSSTDEGAPVLKLEFSFPVTERMRMAKIRKQFKEELNKRVDLLWLAEEKYMAAIKSITDETTSSDLTDIQTKLREELKTLDIILESATVDNGELLIEEVEDNFATESYGNDENNENEAVAANLEAAAAQPLAEEYATADVVPEQLTVVEKQPEPAQENVQPIARTEWSNTEHFIMNVISMTVIMFLYHYITA